MKTREKGGGGTFISILGSFFFSCIVIKEIGVKNRLGDFGQNLPHFFLMYHVPFSHLLNFSKSGRSLDITELVAFKGVRWRFLLGFRLAEKSVKSTLSQYMRKKCVS